MNNKVGRYNVKDAEQLVKIARHAVISGFKEEKEKMSYEDKKENKAEF